MADRAPVITFLSDYGLDDDFVGICHGVIARVCPQARVIDLTHGVPRQDVRRGALILQGALPYLPVGVHLAVVDPDVGAQRRAVAVRLADERLMVGPDNGLLSLAAARAGGVVEAVDIARSGFRLEPVSATFHGRDIFAPVAAALAAGTPLGEVGAPCDPDQLIELSLPEPRLEDGLLIAQRVRVTAGGSEDSAVYVRTFADVSPGGLLIYEDAYRRLSVAVSHGSAAERLGVGVDDELRIALP